MLLKNYQTIL